ncbi:hypothetical protein SDC9_142086 [bioreactor metagenome]|uniref:HTH cro/C1-type domain-containing protein n=1 Tax=bioreactor metagenome TaxID=1076179 RepID=A0A645DZX1_9ZZZZ|nr:helix-turn-helix transcriptional regulator [Candidatus Pelethousia sp.]
MERSYEINKRLREHIEANDKKPSAVADKAKIRRDTFSRIMNGKRPIYADELLPISEAAGIELDFLCRGVTETQHDQQAG